MRTEQEIRAEIQRLEGFINAMTRNNQRPKYTQGQRTAWTTRVEVLRWVLKEPTWFDQEVIK